MRLLLRLFLAIALVAVSASCGKSDEPEPTPAPNCRRTILVYMVATNSLGSYGYDKLDIAEMKEAMSEYADGDCRLLVYRTVYNDSPKLFEIRNNGSEAVEIALKTYPSTLHASVTKQRFSEVMSDIRSFAPADDYGLILWSHADGWATSLHKAPAQPRDFGEDNGAKMHIDSLADALPDNLFSFIYADACYMGAIEVAYQLRKKIDYFIGSAAELPAYGMRYNINLPFFFEKEANLLQACKSTFDYYDGLSGDARTLTISMVDCSKLDRLADVCRRIHANALPLTSVSDMQCYNRFLPHFFFDFGQYTSAIAPDDDMRREFAEALGDAVVYKASTPAIFSSLIIDSEKYSGLSTYIIGTGSSSNEAFYKTLAWYNDVINQ